MRPVVRGVPPVDDAGNPVLYKDYKDARDELIRRMGDYCSYCEIALHSQIDVEHVLPKTLHPESKLKWSNFLLACGNCNSTKLNKPVVLQDFYWPDQDNTARVFVYEQDKPPQIADDPAVDAEKAQRTLELTGIDRVPGHPRLSNRDRRWLKRFEAWSIALQVANLIQQHDTNEMRSLAVQVALGRGFWSVWFAVFRDDRDMRRRLIESFPGTAADCFDDSTNLQPRPGGAA
jgi:uncharacterized protein (TIGR02646 family)